MAVRELNTKEAQAGFNVAHMTLYNYRQPRADRDPLPSEVKGGHRVFKLTECQRWAKKHGVNFSEPPVIPLGAVGRKPGEAKKAVVKKAPAKKAATAVKQKAPAKKAAPKKTAVKEAKPKAEEKSKPKAARAARVAVQPADQQAAA